MKHILFGQSDKYRVAVLVKGSAFNKQEIERNYIRTLTQLGVSVDDCIAFTLKYDSTGKASVKYIKEYLDLLLPELQSLGVTHLYVTDAAYFKVLTKQSKAEPHFGYVLPCVYGGLTSLSVTLGVNYQALIYNPVLQAKLDSGLVALSDSLAGVYVAPGANIIHSAHYPDSVAAIEAALDQLHQYPSLTADIEAFSLGFHDAGIGSCAFAWDQHNGLAFACDYSELPAELCTAGVHGEFKRNVAVRAALLRFFMTYKGDITWHNATYDLKVIIYTLWMHHLLDTSGLLAGLEVMTRDFHDTKIIAYLATNTTAGNVLGLKPLAHEFAGNWAKDDIKDIRKIPLKELLQYNLVDALSTWYAKDKFTPVMIQDNQEELYYSLMLPSLKTIIQMELTGMPMDANRIREVKQELQDIQQVHLDTLENSPIIQTLNLLVQNKAMVAANAKLKVKQHPLEKFKDVVYNPNSGPQTICLLYEQMGLPILDTTDSGLPATGNDTLEKLVNHTDNPDYKALIAALIGLGNVSKILTSFIPAFEKALVKIDGRVYLHGGFNLGGTVSGRLSSSKPNLQNLPAGSLYGKLIKSCFMGPEGWLMVGADFNSLEDMISALTTKDKNKLKVYTDGYCGHCLRAYAYFKDELPEVRQAESTDRCFSLEVNGQLLVCKSGDLVTMEDGTQLTIEEYFDTHP